MSGTKGEFTSSSFTVHPSVAGGLWSLARRPENISPCRFE